MCGIIGVALNKPSARDYQLVRRVFLESSIRGLHATGMSFLPYWSSSIQTIIEPKPADQFVKIHLHNDNLKHLLNADGNLYLIGHCRYSTSDLEYNQPIYNSNLSIVHNGVISQELPENWKELYGYDTSTKNDSELLLHTIESGKEPFEVWENSSIAAIELHISKKLVYYRNGKRPIYQSVLDNGVIVTSTADIMHRASKGQIVAKEVEKDLKTSYNNAQFEHKTIYTNTADLQHVR